MVLVFVSLNNYIFIICYTYHHILLYPTLLYYRQCAGYGERGDPTSKEGRDGRGAGVADRC